MATHSLAPATEAYSVAIAYLSQNKSCLSKTVKIALETGAEIQHSTLNSMCKYLVRKGIAVSEGVSAWCNTRTGLTIPVATEVAVEEAESAEDVEREVAEEIAVDAVGEVVEEDAEVRLTAHVEVIAPYVLPLPPATQVLEEPASTDAGAAKAKRGRPKGSKTGVKGPIEPVELTEWQEQEIREAELEDSHLLAELIPIMGRYVETATSHFCARAVHLTLKGHYNYIDLLNYYRQRMPDKVEISSYSLVREVGTKCKYKHTHVLLCFSSKVQVRATLFHYKNEEGVTSQPNIRSKNHRTSIEAVVAYHYKDGDFPHTNIRIKQESLGAVRLVDLLALCPSLPEAMSRFCKPDLSNVRDITTAYEAVRVEKCVAKPLPSLRLWQQEVMIALRRNAHSRQILFVVDTPGKGGKSKFADHVASQMSTLLIRLTKSRDAAAMLAKEYFSSRDKKLDCIVFDFTRATDNISDIFDFLEQVRDGRVSSGKYVSVGFAFETPPQVLVLVNKSVDISLLTIDRYRIWFLLIDHDSPISFGKKFLSQYAGPDGHVNSEGNTRYTTDILNLVANANREYSRRIVQEGLYSDSSADEDGALTLTTLMARTTAVVDSAIVRKALKRERAAASAVAIQIAVPPDEE